MTDAESFRGRLLKPLLYPLPWWRERKRRKAPPELVSLREALLQLRAPPDGVDGVTAAGVAELWAANPEAMLQLDETYLECQRFLSPRDQPLGQQRVLDPVHAALELQRQTDTGPDDRATALPKVLASGAAHASAYVAERAERNARRAYARGLLRGVLFSAALLALLGLLVMIVVGVFGLIAGRGWGSLDSGEYWSLRDSLVCIGGGAAGAVVSVLLRLSHVERLDYRTIDGGAAIYRVAIGWFFAAALLFLVKGGIVTIFTDPSAKLIDGSDTSLRVQITSWFWWGGFGFLAGFNERWARNLFSRDPTDTDRSNAAAADQTPPPQRT
jgi:hypothetical protein